jgi:hypothetical protein
VDRRRFLCRSGYESEFPFDADPEPDPNWHQNDTEPDSDLTQVLSMLEYKGKKFTFIHSLTFFSSQLRIMDSIFTFYENKNKKYKCLDSAGSESVHAK